MFTIVHLAPVTLDLGLQIKVYKPKDNIKELQPTVSEGEYFTKLTKEETLRELSPN